MAKEIRDETTHVNDENPDDAFNTAFDEILEHIDDDDNPQLEEGVDEETSPQGSETEVDETPVEDTVADNIPDNTRDEIPAHLVAAGRGAGLSDEEIVKLADSYPKALEAMAARDVPETTRQEPEELVEEETQEQVPHVEFTVPEGVDAGTRTILEQMAANQNLLIDKLNDANSKMLGFEEVSLNQHVRMQQEEDAAIDNFFDAQHEVCPALGVNATLTEAELAARQEVFKIAEVVQGGTLEARLEKAIHAYNGMSGTAEQNLQRKLYKNKTRFSPRPGGKKPAPTFKTDDDRARAAFDAAFDSIETDS